jgi:hypothetical protein
MSILCLFGWRRTLARKQTHRNQFTGWEFNLKGPDEVFDHLSVDSMRRLFRQLRLVHSYTLPTATWDALADEDLECARVRVFLGTGVGDRASAAQYIRE